MHDLPQPDSTLSPRPRGADLSRRRDAGPEGAERPAARPSPAPCRSAQRALAEVARRGAAIPAALLALLLAAPADAQQDEPRPTSDPLLYATTEVTSPAGGAALPFEGLELPPEAVPEGFVQVDPATMDPQQLLQVRTFDIAGERIGSIEAILPAGAGIGGAEAAVVAHGGFLGFGREETAIPFESIAVLADAEGNALRVVLAMTEDELDG